MKTFLFATFALSLVFLGMLLSFQQGQPEDGTKNLTAVLAGQSAVKRFENYAQLENFVRSNSQAGYYGGVAMKSAVMGESAPSAAGMESSSQQRAADYSNTNVQVKGVDEADFVKSDGKYLYVVSGYKVVIMDAYPAESAKVVSTISLDNYPTDLYINGDKLIVLGNDYQRVYATGLVDPGAAEKAASSGMQEAAAPSEGQGATASGEQGAAPSAGTSEANEAPVSAGVSEKMMVAPGFRYVPSTPAAFAYVYDVSDRSAPVLKRNLSVDGNYYASRMVGDYVYIVATQPVYYVDGPRPVPLPRVYSGGVEKEVQASDIYYFDVPDRSYVYTNVVSLNAKQDAEEAASKTFLTGYAQSLFMSLDNLYLAYPKQVGDFYLQDRLVDEVLLPAMPADIQAKIKDIQGSNISSYEKMEQIEWISRGYIDSLDPETAAALMKGAEAKAARIQEEITKEIDRTVVHKIALSSGKIEYKAKGEVAGHALNQFSMDEYKGYFRIATTTNPFWGWGGPVLMQTAVMRSEAISQEASVSGLAASSAAATPTGVSSTEPNEGQDIVTKEGVANSPEAAAPEEGVNARLRTPADPSEGVSAPMRPTIRPPPEPQSQNNVYVLDSGMNTVGKLEDLAPGERIYSARFMGDKAYLVTFKQIDPLFVIDLSVPASPKVLGYLKIPGVSDYLHPYDDTHVIGVGRDATEEGRVQGMKLSLFDVSDVANPKEVSKYLIGDSGTYSEALNDHKAFLFSREKSLLVLPVSVTEGEKWNAFQGAYVFNVDLQNGFVLKGKVSHTPQGKGEWYGYNDQIRRSLYMENVLYTVSGSMVKMNDLGTMAELNKIDLPQEAGGGIIYY